MKICRTVEEMKDLFRKGSVGFVPTMGALHAGHMSLVEQSICRNETTIVSIFVNPAQFAPAEDLNRYPSSIEADIRMLEDAGTACLFLPSSDVVYPDGYCTYVIQEGLTQVLCGRSRPTHFRGVLTVVLKLLNIVSPDNAYFGQKDYQQSVVIRRMAEDLNLPVRIHVMPIVREKDGLAMSSRNLYLDSEQRQKAPVLYRALCEGRDLVLNGERTARTVVDRIRMIIADEPSMRIDYVSAVHPDDLLDVTAISGPVVLAGAVYLGRTRLIDNIIVEAVG